MYHSGVCRFSAGGPFSHHATADGLSAATFHHGLLEALRDPRSQDSSLSVSVPDLPVPPIDSATEIGPSSRKLLSMGDPSLSFIIDSAKQYIDSQRCTCYGSQSPSQRPPSHSPCFEYVEPITPLSLQHCGSSRRVPSRVLVDTKYNYLSTNIAISLRRVIGVRDTEICDYASDFFVTAPVDRMFS
ncbi:hypothetical protein DFH07DRAFT_154481 [Mycena maculata]|uniref:Uncharacterized protein n=1 Tax=Mycena maculata TaxID=230809 RepID=A0AAD7HYR0_9AGAR|nr:hypothetical protein DFH07DRAFT_154481 [Mycena maculata]